MAKALRVDVHGFDSWGNRVGTISCRDQLGKYDGKPWVTPKQAKGLLKGKGAVTFKRENIWPEDYAELSNEANPKIFR